MTSPLRFIALIALAAAGLLAGASSANAAKTPQVTKKFTYKAELEGVQTTTWSINHVGAGPAACDMDQTGQGKETIRFTSKPTLVRTYDGLSQPFFFTGEGDKVGMWTASLRGTVNRKGSVFTQPLPPGSDNCPDGVPTAPPTPDCGTKKITGLKVTPEYEYKQDRIIIDQADAAKGYEFKHCPGGSPWPYLLDSDTAGKTIGQELPYQDLFEQGKNIIIATGVRTEDNGDFKATTKIRWVLSLTRVKVEDLTKKG